MLDKRFSSSSGVDRLDLLLDSSFRVSPALDVVGMAQSVFKLAPFDRAALRSRIA